MFLIIGLTIFQVFPDAKTVIPRYTVNLAQACVEGIFDPEDNEEAGHGDLWTLVFRDAKTPRRNHKYFMTFLEFSIICNLFIRFAPLKVV